jgi:hypothetical protein
VGRASSLGLVVVTAAAAGALVATARQPGGNPTRAEVDQVVAELAARLRETAAAARSRAQTLADLPRRNVAVATEAPTDPN